jgi:hypothetical protein
MNGEEGMMVAEGEGEGEGGWGGVGWGVGAIEHGHDFGLTAQYYCPCMYCS